MVAGDGELGWPSGAPFDRIIVTASTDHVPEAWRDQLVDGGLLELTEVPGGPGVVLQLEYLPGASELLNDAVPLSGTPHAGAHLIRLGFEFAAGDHRAFAGDRAKDLPAQIDRGVLLDVAVVEEALDGRRVARARISA